MNLSFFVDILVILVVVGGALRGALTTPSLFACWIRPAVDAWLKMSEALDSMRAGGHANHVQFVVFSSRDSNMVRVTSSSSIANMVRRKVARSNDRFWHVEDFEGGPKAVEMALSRLVEAGALERVRRNVYWHGSRTRFGMTVAPSVAVVRKVVGGSEAVGAAEWYATNLLGLSTQVAPVPVVAVSRRTPTGIPDVRIISRAGRTGRRDARLNDVEVTILEALDGWHKFVEVDAATATDRFLRALQSDSVRLGRLVAASRTEPSRVRERLRYLLREAGQTAEADKIERARSRSGREHALAVVETRA